MTLSLESLPSALIGHHISMCKQESPTGVKEKLDTYKCDVGGLVVFVAVFMQRSFRKIVQGTQYCGGKLVVDRVVVLISPRDREVEDIVTCHLKSQMVTSALGGPKMPLFNEIEINDRRV